MPVSIVFCKATEAKVVRMGGDIWCSNWEQRIVYYVDLGEMEYKCVYREGQKLLSRAKVWSTLSTTTLDFEYSPTRMI